MKKEIAFILGALEDGCLFVRKDVQDYTIEIEQKYKKWLIRISDYFVICFDKKPKITKTKKGYFRLRIYSKEIFNELFRLRKNILKNNFFAGSF